jgi:hypothetical protein
MQDTRKDSNMQEVITMDTFRPDYGNTGTPVHLRSLVECVAHLMIKGEDVKLSVIAFGHGSAGTERAFEKMEMVLDEMGYTEARKVRVY